MKTKKPVFCVKRTFRQVIYIALTKGKQKETKERNHKSETTPQGNVKYWKVLLSRLRTPSPAVIYARMKSNTRYKPGD